jgi:hypothetical protein
MDDRPMMPTKGDIMEKKQPLIDQEVARMEHVTQKLASMSDRLEEMLKPILRPAHPMTGLSRPGDGDESGVPLHQAMETINARLDCIYNQLDCIGQRIEV